MCDMDVVSKGCCKTCGDFATNAGGSSSCSNAFSNCNLMVELYTCGNEYSSIEINGKPISEQCCESCNRSVFDWFCWGQWELQSLSIH